MDQQSLTARHARTTLSPALHRRLKELAAKLDMTVENLLREGVLLLLRYHEIGEGLPEPMPPSDGEGTAK